MKKLIFTVLITVSFFMTLNAQTAALHKTTGAQLFKGSDAFQKAYNAAESGDTIYLSGGGFNAVNINKKLTIFGAGHYPDSTSVTGKTVINGGIQLMDDADGTHIEGLDIKGGYSHTLDISVDNVVIKYCLIDGSVNINGYYNTNLSKNILIVNCVINNGLSLSHAQNAGIFNSIISNGIDYSKGNYVKNSIIFYNSTEGRLIRSSENNIFENNIFAISGTYSNLSDNASKNNTFNFNLTNNASPNYGTTPTLSGNYEGVNKDIVFVNQTGANFNYEHNYHLQNPEVYLGADNTQVGIYGGLYPYKEGAVPSNPHFISADVAPNTNSEGKLEISIKASAQER